MRWNAWVKPLNCVCVYVFVGLTGCWGASLRVLKTCATLPRALRCMRKLGRAQRVARLITLQRHTHLCSMINYLNEPLAFSIVHHPVTVVVWKSLSRYLRQRVLRGWPLLRPVARYSKSSVNSWFSPNSTTSLKCFTCCTTVYNCRRKGGKNSSRQEVNTLIMTSDLTCWGNTWNMIQKT